MALIDNEDLTNYSKRVKVIANTITVLIIIGITVIIIIVNQHC